MGDDANPCSRTAPCKTWPGAISKTVAGGEIDALDPGGFGGLTVTKSITLDGGGGQVASTLVGGSNGIVFSAGATDILVIRNIRFQGVFGNGTAATPGLSGIVFNAGKALIVDNCDITGFSVNGITVNAAGYVGVNNTRIENVANAGILVAASGSNVDVNNVKVYLAKFGVGVLSGGKATVTRSVFSNNTNGVEVDSGGNLFVDNSVMSFNTIGVVVGSGGTGTLSNNDITFNGTGVGGGGTASSYDNNRVAGNGGSNAMTLLTPTDTNPRGMQ
ncbi:MAG: right-handed parallel beta-helix repeat-containing protein [Hyphomicrobiales bacterium]|nr:right-handed parallel beta-helix repeat-containing protein [Hyphomicrobiales bacterium]MBV8825567.1 right-handed parallel beta-helix repeat-containing protein [Hyphomicrobiales bacterium]MBV9430112.1 right-handed parallel beta-helix repeat-containing protein [Bradyrhizobiaceae bacterium]